VLRNWIKIEERVRNRIFCKRRLKIEVKWTDFSRFFNKFKCFADKIKKDQFYRSAKLLGCCRRKLNIIRRENEKF
jgi:hypothetical protein